MSARAAAFLAGKVRAQGNLIFALDATASREPTWDMAAQLQAEMFHAAAGLNIQLVYYRGFGECKASGWMSDPMVLARLMSRIRCESGMTQIHRVLQHGLRATAERKIGALVFVGDACEESHDQLLALARELSTPVFLFQEGDNHLASMAFGAIARATRGAHLRFGAGSAKELGELLRAVAAFAVGGVAALEHQGSAAARLLLGQIR